MALMTVRLNANRTLAADLLKVGSDSSTPLTLLMHPSAENLETPLKFVFPYNPVSVTYNNLSDEVAQVPRPGATPLVFFKAHRLMSVEITFTLAVPGDGLVQPVDDQIEILRIMAQNSQRVIQVLNYDKLLKNPFPYRNMSADNSSNSFSQDLFFTVVEFSLDSVRRNKSNEISQANCRLSLIENRNPFQNITAIPKLQRPPRNGNCEKWKSCCPKKFKKNCPPKTKTKDIGPSIDKTLNQIVAPEIPDFAQNLQEQQDIDRLKERERRRRQAQRNNQTFTG